jgi:hypothetical protein
VVDSGLVSSHRAPSPALHVGLARSNNASTASDVLPGGHCMGVVDGDWVVEGADWASAPLGRRSWRQPSMTWAWQVWLDAVWARPNTAWEVMVPVIPLFS